MREVYSFERLEVPGKSVILRLTADAGREAPPALGIYAGDQVHRVPPVPLPRQPDGLLRVTYELPAELLDEGPGTFWLELTDGAVLDLPAPERAGAQPAATRRYRWRLRGLMAARGMFATTDLAAPLADRGIQLSAAQIYRLVTGTPQRLSLELLAALCDILDCTPNDLIECRAATPASRGAPRRP
jgi:DNA-binding Xre family transcriptional regulator